MTILSLLAAHPGVAPIDLAFARLLARTSEEGMAELVALTGALVSAERGRGHSCIQLEDWAALPFPDAQGRPYAEGGVELPPLDAWWTVLRGSPLAGDGSRPTPLIFDDTGRVSLYRYHEAECRIARRIGSRLAMTALQDEAVRMRTAFQELFPGSGDPDRDRLLLAAAAALYRPFAIISGGPGTGKTTTVVKILALLASQTPGIRIALAAPTGKAAARLSQSIGSQVDALPVPESVREAIPQSVVTLHRLLGYSPSRDRFLYDEHRPLSHQVVVVDEASMVDLLLMEALFKALPLNTRVILLGDSGQLASVETGYVLGDLCRAGEEGSLTPAFARFAEGLSDYAWEHAGDADVAAADHALTDAVVELSYNWRFKDSPGVGNLAAGVRRGSCEVVLHLLQEPHEESVVLDTTGDAASLGLLLTAYLEAMRDADGPAEALAARGRFQVLAAMREGPRGVHACNRAVEEAWRVVAGIGEGGEMYHGRSIMVTANDYRAELFNGDMGVVWMEEGGELAAWFPTAEGVRRVELNQLPPHVTAWAMTVHKSQGSEFDFVVMSLPEADSPMCTRELFYTGVTRARHRVHLLGSEEAVATAVQSSSARSSGLVKELRAMS
ncbi:MAG: exodeoxyribonuclease V subunit alpha [Planctomycetota bacterium]|jgi:exodeoxyribonuclease V alpha subunit